MSRDDDFNPFQSPLAVEPVLHVEGDAELTRRKYLSHEASIQSIGVLWMLGGVVGVFFLVMMLVTLASVIGRGKPDPLGAVIVVIFTILIGLLAFAGIYSGYGLRKLDPKVRVLAVLYAIPGLFGFPIGTIISVYAISLLTSAKGRYIMSPEYAAIRAATPHIRYKTSIIVWIFVGLLVAVAALAVVGLLMNLVAG